MTKQSNQSQSFLKKNATALVLGAAVAAFMIYIFITNENIHWGGFIAMIVFYALVYYVGAFYATKKSNSLSDMMVAKRSIPLVSQCSQWPLPG